MGQTTSVTPDWPLADDYKYADAVFTKRQWQGISIDSSLQRFSGLNSNDELNNYRDQVLYGDGVNVASNVLEKLGSELGGLIPVPNAVGLVALTISMILEQVGKALNKETLGTAQMLERVFAQEKAREVYNLMDEYLKRLQINLRNHQQQLAETKRIEVNLSMQLTRLKNSMLKDGHISSKALKQWVNGAAFHTQMLIHEARLEGRTDGPKASQAAAFYQKQLNALLEKYKAFLPTVLSVRRKMIMYQVFAYTDYKNSHYCSVHYYENGVDYGSSVFEPDRDCAKKSRIVDAMFSRPQIDWAKTYFSELQANITTLVRQNSLFHVYTHY